MKQTNMIRKGITLSIVGVIFLILSAFGMASEIVTDYSQPGSWAIYAKGEGSADLFFICPTVDMGSSGNHNMNLENEIVKASFLGASRMELGIYDENAVIYVPYYQQVTFPVYSMSEEEAEAYFDIAFMDVKAAFEYYMEQCDQERPLILAGFSQGADMIIRLLKEYGNEETLQERLVAAYAIGWRLTETEILEYPWLIPATGKDDTGCIILFNSEAEGITDSLLVPEGIKTYSINPLNWKTDGTPADRIENRGACFTDYSGTITNEIPALTGAVIDSQRGTLICTDIEPSDYSNTLFPDGVYHLYDYQFFYRNLQENVAIRLQAWQARH